MAGRPPVEIDIGACVTGAPARLPTSARTCETVGSFPVVTTTRTMLFLSRKVTRSPEPVCAQPSGYFIEYPALGLWNVRKTWLSGMSPAAADCASACRAPGVVELLALGAVTVPVEELVEPWAGVGAAACFEPQPATASSPPAARSKSGRRIG